MSPKQCSIRAFQLCLLTSLIGVAASRAATINTTLTVSNATGSTTAAGISATGAATLTTIGSGTFTGTLSLSPDSAGNFSAPFTITLTTGDKITGTLSIPSSALTGTLTGSATITGGTGTYANATGSFPKLTGSLTLIPSASLSFSGAGTITTGGTTGGGGGGGQTGPTITTVQNNYGLIAPGLPNFALAPSTLFFIQGTNLANTTTDLISSASPGLPTTLSNVSVSVTSGGTTLQCPLYYLSPTQIDAVLPGATALGTATITVTNNGVASAAFQVPVVQSAFGLLSYNGTLAAAYDANYGLLTATNAANPGQAIVLWGSGVGRDSNDDDKLFPQAQDDLSSIPMQVYIGGVQSQIAYRGRSQFPGVDQIVLTVPSNTPTGCYVSLAVVSGNMVSNSATIPVAASGKTCSDQGTALPPGVLSGLSGKTTINEGVLSISQSTSVTSAGTQTTSSVGGIFSKVSGFGSSAGANQVSLGSCIVYYPTASTSTASSSPLDAGSAISVTGPAGSLTLSQNAVPFLPAGFYAPPGGTTPAGFLPSGGGSFTFDNGSGGKDVQHFNTTLALPSAFTWTNSSQISSVTRSQGVNVTWSPTSGSGFVEIAGTSTATANGKSTSVTFSCQAPVSAGQFSVPVPVLLALPASSNGSLTVENIGGLQLFTAPGLDLGVAEAVSSTSKTVSYQ